MSIFFRKNDTISCLMLSTTEQIK